MHGKGSTPHETGSKPKNSLLFSSSSSSLSRSLSPPSPLFSDHNWRRRLTNKKKQTQIRQNENTRKKNRYAPLVLLQLALVEASALLPRAALACVAALFVAARLLHASSMMAYGSALDRRVKGMWGTFVSIAVLSSCCVVAAVKAVLP